MPSPTSIATPVPLEALRQFENFEGIPLDVIAELFSRIKLPANLQTSFWEAVAAKDYKTTAGRVQIVTKRDGTKEVTIFPKVGDSTTFVVPDDLTNDQLTELTRAQNFRLAVGVSYQMDGVKKPVERVVVFPTGMDLFDDDGEKKLF